MTPKILALTIIGISILIYLTRKYINKLFEPSWTKRDVSLKGFIRKVKSGEWRYMNFLGISSMKKDFHLAHAFKHPGLICVGSQGSGKTFTMAGSLLTEQLVRGDICVQFLIDSSDKAMGDFQFLFDRPNVVRAVRSNKKLLPAIELIYGELKRRGEVFALMGGVKDIFQYNEIMSSWLKNYKEVIKKSSLTDKDKKWLINIGENDLFNLKDSETNEVILKFANGESLTEKERQKLDFEKDFVGMAHITIAFEEFHKIANSKELDFENNKDQPGSIAANLFQLARVGRAYGFQIYISTQKASYREIPSDIKPGITSALAHRVTDASMASSLELEKAVDLPKIPGRSITKGDAGGIDEIQQPHFFKDTQSLLLEDFGHEFKGELLSFDVESAKKICQSEGIDGFIESYNLDTVIANHTLFDGVEKSKIIKRILKEFGYEVEIVDDDSLEIDSVAIHEESGRRYGLMMVTSRGGFGSSGPSDKKLDNFIKELPLIEAEGAMIVNFGPGKVGQRQVKECGGFCVELEDLQKIARVLSSKDKKDPEDYQKLYESLPFIADEMPGSNPTNAKKGAKIDSEEVPSDELGEDSEDDDFWDDLLDED